MKHKGVTLEASDYRRIQANAMAGVQQLSDFGRGDTSLSLFHGEGDTRVYQRKVPGSTYGELTSCGPLPCSLDEVHYALYNASSKHHRTFLALHYGDDYLEGSVLNTTYRASDDDPFLFFGVKYLKMYMPGTTMFEPRDAIYIEFSASSTDAHGRRVVFILKETHLFHEAPPYAEVVRFNFHSMQLFTEIGPDHLEVVTRVTLDSMGKIPTFLSKKYVLRELLLGTQLPQLLQKRRLVDSSPTNGHVAPPISDKACTSCNAKFGAFRAATHCTACGHGICKTCRVVVFRAMQVKSVSPVAKLCFCKACSIQARVSRAASVHHTGSAPSHAASSSSVLSYSGQSDPIDMMSSKASDAQSDLIPLETLDLAKKASHASMVRRSSSDSTMPIDISGQSLVIDQWMMDGGGSVAASSQADSSAFEILQHMHESLEDQKVLLQMMRLRIAEKERQQGLGKRAAPNSSS
ncbi:Aste57867_3982 [Aphanomyces stellatus]|uniref:Aste57867_3982 protein n=1 Tax=Aphanomyces stellatus TaxID=120398 RepID=A0A485KGC1_9STRA|nr:hypothetical protein As57867_003971 [Aphanomyces stellatus]VFT81119.1 Aste57867_3982 [Aphanomyces stellatus]